MHFADYTLLRYILYPIPPKDRTIPFNEISQLIDATKQRAAIAINAEITMLYWQVGDRQELIAYVIVYTFR